MTRKKSDNKILLTGKWIKYGIITEYYIGVKMNEL